MNTDAAVKVNIFWHF